MILAPLESAKPSVESSWGLTVDGFDPLHEAVLESMFAVSNGYLGVQSSLPEGHAASNPATFVSGMFTPAGQPATVPELIAGPNCLSLRIIVEGQALGIGQGHLLQHRRHLDMRRGLVQRDWLHRDRRGRVTRVRLTHCASIANRHLLLQRLELTPENYTGEIWVEALLEPCASTSIGLESRATTIAGTPVLVLDGLSANATIAFALATTLAASAEGAVRVPIAANEQAGERWAWQVQLGRTYELTKLVAVHSSREDATPIKAAAAAATSPTTSWMALRDEHESAWLDRWTVADVELASDAEAQQALRFAVYHLIGAANPDDEHVSIGARALTGESYKGHVFWDTDIFLLPFYLATQPAAARALLMYRYHTLPAARAKAARLGYRGALYAWESADTGDETTPEETVLPTGEMVPIWTGRRAQHISADVAYAVWQYWRATHDVEFLSAAGAEILVETARFWASRATLETDGRYHIRGVIGPDEYHELIDDNAYTNAMARMNLRRASAALDVLRHWGPKRAALTDHLHIDDAEPSDWLEVADGLVNHFDVSSGLIEQFEGYHRLEEVDLGAYEPRTVPMDVLLGRERTARTKVIKQADVLMLLYLLSEDYPASVVETNYDYYERRTGHGSSLSPGIHAALAARLSKTMVAERYFAQTAAIDLDDGMGNAAGGVHVAALGSLWQAAVCGYGGVQWLDESLAFHPRIPARWASMRFRLEWRGRRFAFHLCGVGESLGEVRLEAGPPVHLVASGQAPRTIAVNETLQLFGHVGRFELREGRARRGGRHDLE